MIVRWTVVLFASKDEMIAEWRQGIPDTISNLYVGYDINKVTPTIATIIAGYVVSGAGKLFDSLGAFKAQNAKWA